MVPEVLQELHVGGWLGMGIVLLVCVYVFWRLRDRRR